MNKKALIVSLVIIVGIVGGGLYLARNKDGQGMAGLRTTPDSNLDKPIETPPEDTTTGGKYVDYKAGLVASTPGTKLLFFHAPWCPQCRALEEDFKAAGVPDGVTIMKVDYDSNQSLRKKYGVTLQTTFVKVDDAGNLIKKYTAYDEPTAEAVKTNLL